MRTEVTLFTFREHSTGTYRPLTSIYGWGFGGETEGGRVCMRVHMQMCQALHYPHCIFVAQPLPQRLAYHRLPVVGYTLDTGMETRAENCSCLSGARCKGGETCSHFSNCPKVHTGHHGQQRGAPLRVELEGASCAPAESSMPGSFLSKGQRKSIPDDGRYVKRGAEGS